MQIRNDRSNGNSTTRDEGDDLLYSRIGMLGLGLNTIERDYSEMFDKIKRRCMSCGLREVCAVDLKRDPNNLVWEAYCPNSGVLNALVELTEVTTID
jgi:hypothetical protein